MNFCSPFNEGEHEEVYENCVDLHSQYMVCSSLLQSIDDLKLKIILNSFHFIYRLPWMIAKPQRSNILDRFFASHRPENDQMIKLIHLPEFLQFINTIKNYRKDIILMLLKSDFIIKQETFTFHNSECTSESFFSSLVIPPLFGQFIGDENVNDFIEAVGAAFDSYETDESQDSLVESFDSSFLCRVLRQFFFAPFMREFIGDQFTMFNDFFTYPKEINDRICFSRFQRFSTAFFNEILNSIAIWPSFILRLFQRISMTFYERKPIMIAVLVNSIIIPMLAFPITFQVLPVNTYFQNETSDTLNYYRYYVYTVMGLSTKGITKKNIPEIKPNERFDKNLLNNLIDKLLDPKNVRKDNESYISPIDDVVMNCCALRKLAQLYNNESVLNRLSNYEEDSLILIPQYSLQNVEQKLSFTSPSLDLLNELSGAKNLYRSDLEIFASNKLYRITVHTIKKYHPEIVTKITSQYRADLETIKQIDKEDFKKQIVLEIEDFKEKSIDLETKLITMNHILDLTKKGYDASEDAICLQISKELYGTIKKEVNRKKKLFYSDSNAFSSFLTQVVDNYYSRNQWATPFIPQIGKSLFTLIMKKLPLEGYYEVNPDLHRIDQQFLEINSVIVQQVKNGFDDKVAYLLENDAILANALSTVLRACLIENPIESSREIVLALETVEELFKFQFGEPPEANQLMPLLAHLFLKSSLPAPLSFGRWLHHFMQPVLDAHSDWFSDIALNSIEHYFQFNTWMEDLLSKATE